MERVINQLTCGLRGHQWGMWIFDVRRCPRCGKVEYRCEACRKNAVTIAAKGKPPTTCAKCGCLFIRKGV